jgi:hypothetical protein
LRQSRRCINHERAVRRGGGAGERCLGIRLLNDAGLFQRVYRSFVAKSRRGRDVRVRWRIAACSPAFRSAACFRRTRNGVSNGLVVAATETTTDEDVAALCRGV